MDVLRATLPAGTVSGAPKVRAMQIIDELEPARRGPYAGVVGYIDFSGNVDTAIAIRTMLVGADGRASVEAGAGIVADSIAEDEDLECRNKAAALLAAVGGARRIAACAHDGAAVSVTVGLDEGLFGTAGRVRSASPRARRRQGRRTGRAKLPAGPNEPGRFQVGRR